MFDFVGMVLVEFLSLKGIIGKEGVGEGKRVNGFFGIVLTGWGGVGEGTGRFGIY